jgi:AcrR family transcriptional regulator
METKELPHGEEQGEQTRERLLKSAERLFARRGYARTSVRDITRDASCNVAAVNYHFNGKKSLYREMLVRRTTALREQRIARIKQTMEENRQRASLEMVLKAFSEAFLEPLVDESRGRVLMELITRELLDPQMPLDFLLSEMILPLQETLAQAIETIDPGVQPKTIRLCIQSFVAQLIHFVRIRRLAQVGENVQPFAFSLPELIDHMVRFTAAGITAGAAQKSGS